MLQPPCLARSIKKNKEKVSWRAGKTTKTFDLVKNKLNSGYSKIEFRVAGANQDATSTRRCDLSQDPSINVYTYITILFVRNSEDCFPTSFDCIYIILYNI